MYKNILIPVLLDDAQDHATSFAAARALADTDASFTIINVHEPIPAYAFAEYPADFLVENRANHEAALKDVAAAMPEAKAELVLGHAGRGILDYADANGSDCIIIASHRPGLSDYFLGSTASHVVRHAKCCVHVLR